MGPHKIKLQTLTMEEHKARKEENWEIIQYEIKDFKIKITTYPVKSYRWGWGKVEYTPTLFLSRGSREVVFRKTVGSGNTYQSKNPRPHHFYKGKKSF